MISPHPDTLSTLVLASHSMSKAALFPFYACFPYLHLPEGLGVLKLSIRLYRTTKPEGFVNGSVTSLAFFFFLKANKMQNCLNVVSSTNATTEEERLRLEVTALK